jgi:ABC-2 type transport system ATP-binding protein
VGSPDLLFLDEPTAGLDPLAARGVRSLIKAFCAGGKTVFLTTHFMEEAQELCQRVAILDRGKMLACDAPDALRNGSSLEEVFVRLTGRRLHDTVEEPGSSRI